MIEVRAFPIDVPPHSGEALDSWLEAIACRFNTHLADLLGAAGLTNDNNRTHPSARWVSCLHDGELSRLAAATGVQREQIEAMTLSRYDGTALYISPRSGLVMRGQLWGRGRGSRFCPECLAGTGGRWQLSWRLGWSFACVEHRRLLADTCPECRRIGRFRPHPVHVVPNPGYCAGPVPGGSGLAARRCNGDLSGAATLRLPTDHPALAAQRLVLEMVDARQAAFGLYRDEPQSPSAVLNDVRALASRVLAGAADDELTAVVPDDLLAEHDEPLTAGRSFSPDDARQRPGFTAPNRAVTAAIAVTAAFGVLRAKDIPSAGTALRWLVEGCCQRGAAVDPSTFKTWSRGTTSVFRAIQLSAADPFLNSSDRLRYRSSTPTPRPPAGRGAPYHRARSTPTLFWPGWFIRLALPAGFTASHYRLALSGLLQIVGTRHRLSDIVQRLRSPLSGRALSRALQLLEADSHWPGIYTALVRLAEYFDDSPAPIDYDRRRILNYDQLLLGDAWSQLCRLTATVPGVRKEAVARSVLFEWISGQPATRSRFAAEDADFRGRVGAFPAQFTPDMAALFDSAATDFLHSHFIHNEPVTWQPPLSLISDLDLPGDDPDRIDVTQLHRLIRDDAVSLGGAAERLDTTIDIVRYVLERQPAPPRVRPGVRALAIARAELNKDNLTDLYHHQRLTLHEIALRLGVSRRIVTRVAHECGVDVRPPAKLPRVVLQRDWLYEQYVVQRRTLPELAQESGMSTANMARWAKTHQIPLRGRGSSSHHDTLRASDEARIAPKVLRPALASAGGWIRLHRFVAVANFATIRAAAKALGIHQGVLTSQILRLERDLGGPLLERAVRHRPMALTPLGRRVVQAVRRASGGSARPAKPDEHE